MSSPSGNTTKSPLEAAQKIVVELTGMVPEQQALALKFATETLGLKLPTALLPAAASQHATILASLPHTPTSSGHSTDIKSFTALKSPKSDQQFTAVVAYFYQFEAKVEDRKMVIDAETMKDAARLAGRPQVERWNMTLTNAKNAGYLDIESHGKYKLSSVGENLVAITLPGNGGPGQGSHKKPKKLAKKTVAKKSVKKKA